MTFLSKWRPGNSHWPSFALVALLVLLAHAVLIVSDARFLDGTVFENLLETGRWDILAGKFYSRSLQPWAWLLHPLSGYAHPGLIFRSLELAGILLIALSVLHVATRHSFLSRLEAFFLAILVVIVPVYGSAMMSSVVIYLFPTGLFYLAWAAYFDSANDVPYRRQRIAFALVLWSLAFFHNSLLAFHYGIALLLFVHLWNRQANEAFSLRQLFIRGLSFAKLHALMLAWPPLFYFLVNKVVFPKPPTTAGYNQLIFDFDRIWHAFSGNLFHHVVLNLSAAAGGSLIVLALVFLLFCYFLVRSVKRDSAARRTAAIGVLGLFLAVTAIFPYAAIAKAAPLYSFGARYGLLTGLGSALLLLAIWRALPNIKLLRLAIAAIMLLGLASRSVGDDLLWLGRWAKDKAFIHALRELPPPPEGTVLILSDDWRIGGETYRIFELAWFFKQAWGKEAWTGFDPRERSLEETLIGEDGKVLANPYNITSDFQPNGCTQQLVVNNPAQRPDPRLLGLAYLQRRLFGAAGDPWPLEDTLTVSYQKTECEAVPEILLRKGLR